MTNINKQIQVLDLRKGKLHTIEMDYTEEQEQEACKKLEFTVDGQRFAGWCRTCNKPVMWGMHKYEVNTDGLGNVIADCYHNLCDR